LAAVSFLSGPSEPVAFVDVNGDGQLTPLDALLVINVLNEPASVTQSSGEASASASLLSAEEATHETRNVLPTFTALRGAEPQAIEGEEPSGTFAVYAMLHKADDVEFHEQRVDETETYLSDTDFSMLLSAASRQDPLVASNGLDHGVRRSPFTLEDDSMDEGMDLILDDIADDIAVVWSL